MPISHPVFIYSTIRSGSTLLRCILDSNTRIYAPHELHFNSLDIDISDEYLSQSLTLLRFNKEDLKMLLWDILYHQLLTSSGKDIIVDKSPSNIWSWKQINQYWPKSKYIILKRNPYNIFNSIMKLKDGRTENEAIEYLHNAIKQINTIQLNTPNSIAITYENLIMYPEETIKSICAYIHVDYEPAMIKYGDFPHTGLEYGVGDFGANINRGKIVVNNNCCHEVDAKHDIDFLCGLWGY